MITKDILQHQTVKTSLPQMRIAMKSTGPIPPENEMLKLAGYLCVFAGGIYYVSVLSLFTFHGTENSSFHTHRTPLFLSTVSTIGGNFLS